MEEGVAILRQLIGLVQELLHLYASPSPNHLHPPHLLRWCFPNSEDTSIEDSCDLIMTAGKSENLKMMDRGKPPVKRSRKERNHGNETTTLSSTDMEQEIWKEFPEDLFEAVIARLPIATFFKFQSTCKKWNSLLHSHSFSRQCDQVPQTIPWFYTTAHENVNTRAMYDPALKKWHHLTVPAFPTKYVVLPVASAGGLICFLDFGHRSFYVCNPLTRSFKELPARSEKVWSRIAVGMSVTRKSASEGYKILRVGCDGEYEVYDSDKNDWTRPGSMPSYIKIPLALNFRSQTVCIGSTLYFMRSYPDGVVSYDMVSGAWKQLIIPSPLHLSDHSLAECGEKLILVGLRTKNAATCVCIWELQKMTLLWKEVDRMPNIWCLEFYGKHVRMTCLGNRGLLMLSLRSRQMNRLVTYDTSSREWLKVPGCVLPHGRVRQWIACGIAFHPCLTAIA